MRWVWALLWVTHYSIAIALPEQAQIADICFVLVIDKNFSPLPRMLGNFHAIQQTQFLASRVCAQNVNSKADPGHEENRQGSVCSSEVSDQPSGLHSTDADDTSMLCHGLRIALPLFASHASWPSCPSPNKWSAKIHSISFPWARGRLWTLCLHMTHRQKGKNGHGSNQVVSVIPFDSWSSCIPLEQQH